MLPLYVDRPQHGFWATLRYVLAPSTHRRAWRMATQRIRRGFADEDLWNLDLTLAELMVSALPTWRGRTALVWPTTRRGGRVYVQILEGWTAMSHLLRRDITDPASCQQAYRRWERGMQLFTKYFHRFWY